MQIYVLWVDSAVLYCIYVIVIAIITVRIIVGCYLTAGFSGSLARVMSSCYRRRLCDAIVVLTMIVAGEWQSQGELCVSSQRSLCDNRRLRELSSALSTLATGTRLYESTTGVCVRRQLHFVLSWWMCSRFPAVVSLFFCIRVFECLTEKTRSSLLQGRRLSRV